MNKGKVIVTSSKGHIKVSTTVELALESGYLVLPIKKVLSRYGKRAENLIRSVCEVPGVETIFIKRYEIEIQVGKAFEEDGVWNVGSKLLPLIRDIMEEEGFPDFEMDIKS